MKKAILYLLLVVLLILPTINQPAQAAILKIQGAKTLCTPLLKNAKKMRKEGKLALVVKNNGGSEKGIKKVYFNKMDLACVVRYLTEKESRILVQEVLAFDYLVAVVKKDLPIQSLTKEQIFQIFSGQKKRWKELDSSFPDIPIEPIITRKKSGTIKNIIKFFLNKKTPFREDSRYVNTMTSAPKLLTDMKEMGGITILSQSFVIGYENQLKLLALDGVEPTPENVRSGTYPYRRPATLVYKKKNKHQPSIDRLIRYLRDPTIDFFKGKLLPNN